MAENPLGKKVAYPQAYDPTILHPIPRWSSRSLLGIQNKLVMHGVDYWHCYEMSWLNETGKPEVATGEIIFSPDSENIIESKSLKLYLHSLNQDKFESSQQYADLVARDLADASHSEVKVLVRPLEDLYLYNLNVPGGKSIDDEEIAQDIGKANAGLLTLTGNEVAGKFLHSNLFRSNCPITGQPDWASFQIEYSGQEISPGSLLSYICSYRNHQAYHEECAEQIYRDIMLSCKPQKLLVGLNFLRRGGIDINPYRSSVPLETSQFNFRLVRQ